MRGFVVRHFLWLAGLGVACNFPTGPKDDGGQGQDQDGNNGGDDVTDPGGSGGGGDDSGGDDSVDPTPPTHTVCTDGGDFATIQAAIDAAVDGDRVSVCPGTWHENLVVTGKSIELVARDGVDTVTVDGGGIGAVLTVSDESGGVTVSGIAFVNGRSPHGGGVTCSNATLALQDVRLANNLADQGGGGIWGSACAIDMRGAQVEANQAWADGGGGLFESSTGTIADSVFSGNSGDNGGGLAITGSTLLVTGAEVSGNTAFNGGGIWLDGETSVTMSSVTDNTTSYNGGGVYVLHGTASFTGNTVARNVGSEGGGAYFYECANTISGNTFEDNEAADDDAGGSRIFASAVTLEGNVYRGNRAAGSGGAAKVSHNKSMISGNTFENNVAGGYGGGLEIDDDMSDVDDNVFTGNEAMEGGGLHYNEPFYDVVADGNRFESNVASHHGGAIAMSENKDDESQDGGSAEVFYTLTIRHAFATGNSAQDGGGFYTDYSAMNVENSILVDNTASGFGGGIGWANASGRVENVVLYGNDASNGSGLGVSSGYAVEVIDSVVSQNDGGAVSASSSPSPTFRYSDVWGNAGGDDHAGTEGNISGDPKFVNAAAHDFHLVDGSPCIDGGDPTRYDVDSSRADMGAFGGVNGSWTP